MDRRSFMAAVPVVAAARLIGKRTEKQPKTPLGCEKRHREIEAKAGNGLVWCERCGLLYARGFGWCIWKQVHGELAYKPVAEATPREWSEWSLLTAKPGRV